MLYELKANTLSLACNTRCSSLHDRCLHVLHDLLNRHQEAALSWQIEARPSPLH